jgi:nickel/cobalt transporter (NicO) family protein
MATAILLGATSGAVHAVTGPDHLLSLGASAVNGVRRAFRAGLLWGLGHGIGTLLLAIPFVLMSRLVGLDGIATYSQRLAGVALMATALWSLRTSANALAVASTGTQTPVLVGLFHGLTGAGVLVLMLPAVAAHNGAFSVAFLVAFAVGSTLAMATLTAVLGLLGQRLRGPTAAKFQRAVAVAALTLGAVWTLGL